MKKLAIYVFVSLLGFNGSLMAQERSDNGVNPLSLRPIETINQAKKYTLWRRIDLREKVNLPFFAKGSEITKHIIDGVRAGVLEPFSNDSLATKITLEEFNKRIHRDFEGGGLSQDEIDAGFGKATEEDLGWGSETTTSTETKKASSSQDGWGDDQVTQLATGYDLLPSELYLIELKEDWIFDSQRSRAYYDVLVVTIKIPAEYSPEGIERDLASFKYKELESYFRLNPNCLWFNEENTAKHMNYADAIELRLFSGRIVRTSDPRNRYLDQIYKNPREALLKSQEWEYKIMEEESNLWEN
ncbi:gliding motility protein GldN [Leadbetterella byssophila]|uniref:type IX secretion system ring protein PorN/GldN n=1 Tax=Leadbetterella byssophila TaxID=316068 RepID=UPI0039A3154D